MKKNGFSLIEFLVVIGIIAILSGVVFINYRTGQRDLALQRAASKLAQDIRRAQEMAMSAKECASCPNPWTGKVPPGYGILFNTPPQSEYYIFADLDDNKRYWFGDIVVETIRLEEGISIQALWSDGFLSITFTPPDPTITPYDALQPNPSGPAWIRLQNQNDNTKTININAVGSIDID